jgi:hypothetical protein
MLTNSCALISVKISNHVGGSCLYPSYLGDKDYEDCRWRPGQANSFNIENTHSANKGWQIGLSGGSNGWHEALSTTFSTARKKKKLAVIFVCVILGYKK